MAAKKAIIGRKTRAASGREEIDIVGCVNAGYDCGSILVRTFSTTVRTRDNAETKHTHPLSKCNFPTFYYSRTSRRLEMEPLYSYLHPSPMHHTWVNAVITNRPSITCMMMKCGYPTPTLVPKVCWNCRNCNIITSTGQHRVPSAFGLLA